MVHTSPNTTPTRLIMRHQRGCIQLSIVLRSSLVCPWEEFEGGGYEPPPFRFPSWDALQAPESAPSGSTLHRVGAEFLHPR